jgi:hypothetical protein
MCNPLALAALTFASTAASVATQISSANAQIKAINEMADNQQKQISQQQGAEITDSLRQARRDQSRIAVAASQAGLNLSGSVDTLLADAGMQGALRNENTSLNADIQRQQALDSAKANLSRVNKPTALSAGLQIASATAGSYVGAGGGKK